MPVRRAAVPGTVPPATAPDHPEPGLDRTLRVICRRLGIVLGLVPVPAPLPHVAVHVEQAPQVRPHGAARNGQWRVRVTLVEPRVLAQQALIAAATEGRGCPGAAGVFPFGFGRQTETIARRIEVPNRRRDPRRPHRRRPLSWPARSIACVSFLPSANGSNRPRRTTRRRQPDGRLGPSGHWPRVFRLSFASVRRGNAESAPP